MLRSIRKTFLKSSRQTSRAVLNDLCTFLCEIDYCSFTFSRGRRTLYKTNLKSGNRSDVQRKLNAIADTHNQRSYNSGLARFTCARIRPSIFRWVIVHARLVAWGGGIIYSTTVSDQNMPDLESLLLRLRDLAIFLNFIYHELLIRRELSAGIGVKFGALIIFHEIS